ncbi:MAG: HU family DNA-binding protein [bacterium]
MTKQQLIDTIAQSHNLSKEMAKTVVKTVFDSIVEALSAGDKVELRGFGSFKVKQRDGRLARNPKTGAPIEVPSKKHPVFKPGKELKKMVDVEV